MWLSINYRKNCTAMYHSKSKIILLLFNYRYSTETRSGPKYSEILSINRLENFIFPVDNQRQNVCRCSFSSPEDSCLDYRQAFGYIRF